MNRPPEILVNSGFVTDQNGVLTEMVIPSNVVTQNMPSIITTYATTLNWIPSNAATLVEFNAPNIESLSESFSSSNTGLFKGYTALTSVRMDNLTSITNLASGISGSGSFNGCTSLQSVRFDKLVIITNDFPSSGYSSCGTFRYCINLKEVIAPKLQYIIGRDVQGTSSGTFNNCSSLQTVNFPELVQITNYHFGNCTGLTSVTLGSVGHPVTSISNNTFYNCKQSNLSITVYTADGLALSGSPWGATNTQPNFIQA